LLFAQALVVDPAGPALGLSATDAVRVVVGN
jgi:hypothetical protein